MTIVVTPEDPEYSDAPLIGEVQGTPKEIREKSEAFFKTAVFLDDAGADIQVGEVERRESREIFNDSPVAPSAPSSSGVALHLKALITEYDHQVLESNIQARNYIVNRLLDLSDPKAKMVELPDGQKVMAPPAKPSEQLKALELLGKVSEIGLFTERVEVNINNKTDEELEQELVATLTKYMGNAIVEEEAVDPILGIDLDAELGRKPDNESNSAAN